MLTRQCPQCQQAIAIPDELIEKQIVCPDCRHVFSAAQGGSLATAGLAALAVIGIAALYIATRP